jgi:hypothetical protein
MAAGAGLATGEWQGPGWVFGAATGGVLLALALVRELAPDRSDQVVLGMIGGLTSLQCAPGAIGYFARDAGLLTGLATWAVAAVVLYLGIRALVRIPVVVEAVGAVAALVGAAVTATQFEGFATIFGIVTAVGLVGLGMLPGRGLLSLFGSAGLLVNVLWAVNHFFPGEGRAPLLIMVAGTLILATAVLLTRSGAVRRDRRAGPSPRPGPRAGPPTPAPGAPPRAA